MKLIFCSDCLDVFPLGLHVRHCECGSTSGAYKPDLLHAWIAGEKAIPLGFLNHSFEEALLHQPEHGPGARFVSFVIERNCPTIEHLKEAPIENVAVPMPDARGSDRIERVLSQLRLAWRRNPGSPFGIFIAWALNLDPLPEELMKMKDEELGRRLQAAHRPMGEAAKASSPRPSNWKSGAS